MPPDSDVQKRINAIRMLSIDAVQKANSGHPGLPLGAAPMAYAIWANHLKFNAGDLQWADRDRFILSAGHGSMLLYSLLYLTGSGLTLDDLKNFRQFESKTPGHPESHVTAGVEVTTGPLGQGVANAVGFAIAEAHLAAVYNRNQKIVDHYTYVIASDGDLMEGISAESASLAGHLRLGKLIVLYDDNHVSLAAPTEVTFTEDVLARYAAYGWHAQQVDHDDGNDVLAIDSAIAAAKADPRPSLIAVRANVGKVGGIINFCGQISGITASILTGYLVTAFHSYAWAFAVAGAYLAVGIAGYMFLLGKIELPLRPPKFVPPVS